MSDTEIEEVFEDNSSNGVPEFTDIECDELEIEMPLKNFQWMQLLDLTVSLQYCLKIVMNN